MFQQHQPTIKNEVLTSVRDLTMMIVECESVLFQEAKAHLLSLKGSEVMNCEGAVFRFTKQVLKALSDKARDQSVGRAVHWAAVARIEELCRESLFLWDEKPRNGSVDIERYTKHGAWFRYEGVEYIAKIT